VAAPLAAAATRLVVEMASIIQAEFYWVEICRPLAYAMGLVKDFSKGEMLRLNEMVNAQIAKGTMRRLSRGLYQLAKPDATPWVEDEPAGEEG
jgi:hypothetical protein